MKTILAVWNKSEKGKTESIREFAKLLLITYPNYIKKHIPNSFYNYPNWDFRIVIEINGKIIGIESQGDPNTNLENRLLDLVNNFGCDVIICSTRTSGNTVYAVENVASKNGYQIIRTSTYEITGKSQQTSVNNLKAKHILELLQSLNII